MPRKKRGRREEERRLARFAEQQRKLRRRRTFFGVLSLVALGAAFGCGSGLPLPLVCALPVDAWFMVFAAILGWFLGLTLRLVLDRRRFAQAKDGPPA